MEMHDVTPTPRKAATGLARVLFIRIRQAGAAALFGALLSLAPPSSQAGSDTWWDGIQGFGTPDFSGKRTTERTPIKPDVVNDLLTCSTPLRCVDMMRLREKSIVFYESI